MPYESHKGVAKLAATLNERMCNVSNLNAPPLDFGVIQDDYSLKTNGFDKPIPKGEYSLTRQLTLGKTETHLTYTIKPGNPCDGTHSHGESGPHRHGGGTHDGHGRGETGEHVHSGDGQHYHRDEGPHIHDVLIPEKMRSLKPGDRVLVAWVGSEAVVLDIVVKS